MIFHNLNEFLNQSFSFLFGFELWNKFGRLFEIGANGNTIHIFIGTLDILQQIRQLVLRDQLFLIQFNQFLLAIWDKVNITSFGFSVGCFFDYWNLVFNGGYFAVGLFAGQQNRILNLGDLTWCFGFYFWHFFLNLRFYISLNLLLEDNFCYYLLIKSLVRWASLSTKVAEIFYGTCGLVTLTAITE